MSLQESGQMYLEAIFVLSGTHNYVRSVDVGEYLGYSKPSVSRAVGLLKDGGYVVTNEYGHLELTEKGRQIAQKTYERHTVLTEFFVSIGVPKDIATEDACKIEHDISNEAFEALKKHMNSK
ncbi:MAG: metal-dependent transcriptional regulator [Clostridia bacterium]|nr:metal-dependent transcriptional regulator [Clostridia bacterium]